MKKHMLNQTEFIAKKEEVRAVLPESGTRFRTRDISGAAPMLKLFGVSQDDTNYHAQIGQGLLANTDYFRVTRIEAEKENERGALWQRV
ncbi:MAG TPA: hypothetical protein VHV50_07285 [Actinomycetota bacterium]|nr:hypothetical protein [Actinomycetota bacterium]